MTEAVITRIELAVTRAVRDADGERVEEYYIPISGFRVGPFAVHRPLRGGSLSFGHHLPCEVWRISHIATGIALPDAWSPSLDVVLTLARRLHAAGGWDDLVRGKGVGSPEGLTADMKRTARALIDASGAGR